MRNFSFFFGQEILIEFKQKILTENYYKTICSSVRSECSSCGMDTWNIKINLELFQSIYLLKNMLYMS